MIASGQAEGHVTPVVSRDGSPGLRLDYDFHGGGGFVVIRRELALDVPESFTIRLELRGEGPPNHFEFKLGDPGNRNAWRFLRQNFRPPSDWTPLEIRENDLPFAWGPNGGGSPSQVAAIELVIAAGPGGSGTMEFAHLGIVDESATAPAAIRASSSRPNHPATAPTTPVNPATCACWLPEPNDPSPWWLVDYGRIRRFGGLVIEWPDACARAFRLEASIDGQSWQTLHSSTRTRGVTSHIATPGAEARLLRLSFPAAAAAGIAAIHLKPSSFSQTPHDFIHAVAADFPRGWFPRYWYREQSYWTPVGIPGGGHRALVNEEGLVETDEGCFSLEPFILGTSLMTWADVTTSACLTANALPEVRWSSDNLSLAILPWLEGDGPHSTLHVTYRLENHGASDVRLALALRPFQVVPPWQAFRNLGGRADVSKITCTADTIATPTRTLQAHPAADACGAATFDEGGIVAALAAGSLPEAREVDDPTALASAALAWLVPAGTTREVTVSVPFPPGKSSPPATGRAAAIAAWQKTVTSVEWRVPPAAQAAVDSFQTAIAHILINRDGPALQPGPRRYTRSWIRDCVIMGAALAKAGHPQVLHDFLNWYAPFQRADGFIPCVVDRDGIDWLVEHDSHGQFLWAAHQAFLATGNPAQLQQLWPRLAKSAGFLISLRTARTTDEFRGQPTFGLLPESASHEGYLAHPVHSYWDDFWGVRGLHAAADIASLLGYKQEADHWHAAAETFLADLLASINTTIASRQLHYIPGSVEWADFDPTATANAIGLLDFADKLPAAPLHQMLATYLDGFRARRLPGATWLNYTAYEIRLIGALVRLNMRNQANELLEFFLAERRPSAWHQWPEITWRDSRAPGHLGDVPHTWIAAEFILSLAAMVVQERTASNSLVLAAGLPWAWVASAEGFAVSGLATRHGPLSFSLRALDERTLEFTLSGVTLPPGGITLAAPRPDGSTCARQVNALDGRPTRIELTDPVS